MIKLKYFYLFIVCILLLSLTIFNFGSHFQVKYWWPIYIKPDGNIISHAVLYYSLLPRLVMSLVVGAGLGIAGLIYQQVLRNPLAEPATLGVANGAQLGITIATLWGSEIVSTQYAAFIGSLVMGALVYSVVSGKKLSPITLILTGLVFTLYCSSISQLLGLYYHEHLQSVLLWGTGSLTQMDWSSVEKLFPIVLICCILTLIMLRPLHLLGIDDTIAKSLGLSLSLSRSLSLTLATLLSASLVNSVGIIGFIGLFAPLLTKLLNIRRLFNRVLATAAIGALLLWGSDQLAILITNQWQNVSTGTITALLGAPILLCLLSNLIDEQFSCEPQIQKMNTYLNRNLKVWFFLGLCIMGVIFYLSLRIGRDLDGWFLASDALMEKIHLYRLPRVIAAFSAGCMLAIAGCIIQRLTGNPLASPEVLGMSSGAALGTVLLLLNVSGDVSLFFIPAGCIGAIFSLVIILSFSGVNKFSPKKMLLGGMALNAAFSSLLMLAMASGDPRVTGVLTWLAGSTYSMTYARAWLSLSIAIVGLSITPLFARWLTIFPLGHTIASSIGVNISFSRIILMAIAAVLTATSTFIIGPLSFLGLMAPHIARMLGFYRPVSQMIVATIAGGCLMMLSDWLGRMVMFPYQLPAGLISALLGAPFFIWLLRRSK